MIVSKAKKEDIPAVAAIERESFSDPWTEGGFEAELDNAMGIFLAAHDDDGSICGYIIGDCDGYGAYIANIAVSQERRGKGIGTALLDAFAAALPHTAESISLEVRQSNTPALQLYSRYGFEKAGIRKKFYSSPCEDAVVMIMDMKIRGK